MVSCFLGIKKRSVLLVLMFLSIVIRTNAYTPSTGDLNVADAATKTRLEGGKKLFKANCGSCHGVDKKLTGPALMGVWDRWESEAKIIQWVKNNSALRASGDAYANKIFNENGGSVMTGFPSFTDQNVIDIIDYVRIQTSNPSWEGGAIPIAPGAGASGPVSNKPSSTMWWLVVALLGALALGLRMVTKNLDDVVAEKEGTLIEDNRTSFQKIFTPRVKSALIILSILFLGAWLVKSAMGLGRSQGYHPTQPIKFSHELHAGQNKIECQYCHSGVEVSRHAVIPSVSVCMNCHKYVQKGPKYGKTEIAKIYEHSGWDPEKGAFTKAPKPIEWVKIHNLPDHVYFNHSQHVKVGGIKCQTCHGNVQEMEEVKQFASLSMGWCINCHRQTAVQFDNNNYYSIFEKYHDDIKAGKKAKVTVEDIGGTECQKCHY